MPPAALFSTIATPTVGVEAISQSSTSRPFAAIALVIAALSAGPDSRPSLPITTGPAGRVSMKLLAYAAATLSVSDSPTIPRSPETLTISGSECFEFVAVSFFIGFPLK